MKTLLLILPVAGAAWLALSAEPAGPDNKNSTTELSAKHDSVASTDATQPAGDQTYSTSAAERLARSGAVTTRSERAEKRNLLHLLNPLAPVKPAPETPWLSRSAWSTAVTTEQANVQRPVETNHEVKVKVVVWRD